MEVEWWLQWYKQLVCASKKRCYFEAQFITLLPRQWQCMDAKSSQAEVTVGVMCTLFMLKNNSWKSHDWGYKHIITRQPTQNLPICNVYGFWYSHIAICIIAAVYATRDAWVRTNIIYIGATCLCNKAKTGQNKCNQWGHYKNSKLNIL